MGNFVVGFICGIVAFGVWDMRIGDIVYCRGVGNLAPIITIVPRGTGCEQVDIPAPYDNLDPYRGNLK